MTEKDKKAHPGAGPADPVTLARAAVRIRPAHPSDSSAFRALRLEALKNHPEAFAAAYESEAAEPEEYWAGRLARVGSPSIGELFFAEADEGLVGMAGVWRKEGRKVRHAGTVWGVYVRPGWRGVRIGERLVRACIGWARRNRLRILRLASMAGNEAAIHCYERCGFTPYGLEPEAILDGGVAYDDLLMALRVSARE